MDVDGNKVVVTFPAGAQSGRRLLSRHEARVLRLQLHLAYLLAGRNFWISAAGTDATEGEALRGEWGVDGDDVAVGEQGRGVDEGDAALDGARRARTRRGDDSHVEGLACTLSSIDVYSEWMGGCVQ